VVRQERLSGDYLTGRARFVVNVATLAASVLLILSSQIDANLEGVAFAGLGLFLLSLGSLVSEIRRYRRWQHVRGPVALGAAFFLVSAALIWEPPDRSVPGGRCPRGAAGGSGSTCATPTTEPDVRATSGTLPAFTPSTCQQPVGVNGSAGLRRGPMPFTPRTRDSETATTMTDPGSPNVLVTVVSSPPSGQAKGP